MPQLDIIVPVLNEAENIAPLAKRVDAALSRSGATYRLIFVDDHSIDATRRQVQSLYSRYPVVYRLKRGRSGKAFSIWEGLQLASASQVAVIDGDLQYPPEVLPDMLRLMGRDGVGVVVANRTRRRDSWGRRIASHGYDLVFNRGLLGFSCDVQSGLKVFAREVAAHLDPQRFSPWTFDVHLLTTARELGYSVARVEVEFSPRATGRSKVVFWQTAAEIAWGAVKARFVPARVYHLPPVSQGMLGAGVAWRRRRFVTHTTLHHRHSAVVTLQTWQKLFLVDVGLVLAIGLSLSVWWTGVVVVAVLSTAYFVDVIFNLFLVLKSLHFPPEISISDSQLSRIGGQLLPVYSILCPLYHEAKVLPQFVEAISRLDWPKDKLDVLLLLEEDDTATIEAARSLNLPAYFRVLVVPHSQPKTKPKACNYGLAHARGEYVVIYDAEDRPDQDQLKKAYLAFQKVSPQVACLQAKLNYYNPHHNLLTRLFTAEYSLWFDVTLPGLQSIQTAIPLGGTSNHFRTATLRQLEGWDPFNVTEDCDLGVRLFKRGYQTAIIDSVTLEEANSRLGNWLRQRSRWIKGYIQTYLVHMRSPTELVRTHGWHALLFQLVVGGKIAFMLINPLLWLATISYFTLYKFVGPAIESLYPAPVFYMAVTSLVLGNFLFLYYYMIGCAKRGAWPIVKYVFAVPFYWLLVSLAAVKAVWQLVFQPHYWEKTHHGFHLHSKERLAQRTLRPSFSVPPRLAYLTGKLSSGYVSGAVLITASMVGNFFNLLYNVYLGRAVSLEDFGLVSLIGSFIYLTQMPLGALNRTITHHSAYLFGKYARPIRTFWATIRRRAFVVSLLPALGWLVLTPVLQKIFHSPDPLPFWLFTPVWVIATLESVDNGYLSGNLKFKTVGVIVIVEAVSKFVVSILLVSLGLSRWVYAAIPISMTLAFLCGWLAVVRLPSPAASRRISLSTLTFPWKFFGTSFLIKLTTLTFMGFDVILAKSLLSPAAAGAYALLALAGKMVYMLGGQFSQFIIPVVSRDEGAGRASAPVFFKLMAATGVACSLGVITLGLLGHVTAPLLWRQKADLIVSFLPLYSVAMACFTVGTAVVTYHQMRHKNLLPVISFILGLVQVVALWLYHPSLSAFVGVVSLTSIVGLGVILVVHFLHDYLSLFARAVGDFAGLFSQILPQPEPRRFDRGSTRILVFNWRDKKHVWAGGAEEYVHQLAKRWVKMGHQVTLFCGNDGFHPRYENIDGVDIVRRGGFYLVYPWAVLYYLFRFRGKTDVIIDSENGIPFFTPLYAQVKKVLLIHHVHQEVFRTSLPWYNVWLALFLERHLMPVVYRGTPVVTVSPSSKADILDHHLSAHEPQVIYNGVDLSQFKPGPKSPTPMVLYLGRLKHYKSLDIFLRAAQMVLRSLPRVQFVIAGEGEERVHLRNLADDLGISHKVTFLGRVTEKDKISLLQKAWLFVNPSLVEGWGITTIEANACGTPVIASNVGGLRDAVYNPHSGVLVPYGHIEEFAAQISRLVKDHTERSRMNWEAVKWAAKYDWDKSASQFLQIIQGL